MKDSKIKEILRDDMEKIDCPDVWDSLEKRLYQSNEWSINHVFSERRKRRALYGALSSVCAVVILTGSVFAVINGKVLDQEGPQTSAVTEMSDQYEGTAVTENDIFKGYALTKRSKKELERILGENYSENSIVYEKDNELYVVENNSDRVYIARQGVTEIGPDEEKADENGIRLKVRKYFDSIFISENTDDYSMEFEYSPYSAVSMDSYWKVTANKLKDGVIIRQIYFFFDEYGNTKKINASESARQTGSISIKQAAEIAVAEANKAENRFKAFSLDTKGVMVRLTNCARDTKRYYDIIITGIPGKCDVCGIKRIYVDADSGETLDVF